MPHGYYQNCHSSATTLNQWYPQNTYYYPTYVTSNATITYTSPNTTWQQWVNNSTIQTTSGYSANYRWTDEVWQQWVTVPQSYGYAPIVQTPEQIRAGEELYEAQCRERRAAHARARVLLGEFLDEQQKVELDRHGRFHVTGSRGRRYCIRTTGQAGNVDLLKPDGGVQAVLCCHPRQGLPDGDAWLMQMIELRHDEDHFLRTANVHRGSLPAECRRELIRA